ncbi:MAG: two-component system sensor histidine kinase NtrB [Blastocatellia bacterium]
MKRKTANPDQPKLALIYSALTIGFVFLLALVWLIGSRSVSELEAISDLSRDLSENYRSRAVTAGKIQEQAANVIAQASLVQVAKGSLPLPVFPYDSKLKTVGENFNKARNEAREEWSKRTKLQTATPAEMAAWREVELAADRFLNSIKPLARFEEKLAAENSDASSVSLLGFPEFNQDEFNQARARLEAAVTQLIGQVESERLGFLDRIAAKQQQAAAEVSRARWLAVVVGLFVAVAVFMITRSRILELRQAMKSAKSAQDTARSIFDSQSNDILVMAENGELMAANQAFFNRYHLRPSELLLQDYRGALAHLPEVARFIRDTLQLSHQGNQAEKNSEHANSKNITHRQRIEVKTKRGPRQSLGFPAESRLLDVYVSPLTIDRETRGRVVALVDVTEEEHVREELRRNRTLSAVGQITAQVAHELYNPIGAIKLNIELLEMQVGDGDDDLKQSVARLKRGSEHLSTIVTDLRYLTRPRDPERKPTDMNKLMDEVIELASDRLERAHTKVIRQYSSNLQHGNYDPQQLRKVFLNLLINAVEASPQNSQVVLQTGFVPAANGHNAALEVSVVDFGSGMSEETRTRIFEAFYTTKRNGTGLGMMITHEIIKKHNGRIEIESEEGRGTKVIVFLPV